jgi:hypothetical protein
MPNRDRQGPPEGTGPRSGRDMGSCGKDKERSKVEITEKALDKQRGRGLGPCGRGDRNGPGRGNGAGRGRRKGKGGITYFT